MDYALTPQTNTIEPYKIVSKMCVCIILFRIKKKARLLTFINTNINTESWNKIIYFFRYFYFSAMNTEPQEQ